ncbi:MAG: type 1 glutamine amidotransferase, partial [Gammaproteobacteria bacterium]
IDEGMQVPTRVDRCSGLVFMGGPMSVNDDLPWIEDELALIRQAHHMGMPVLGHCLGGQLISKALGGTVTRNPVTEIGWFPVEGAGITPATAWLKNISFPADCFHWHGETFTLPAGALPLFKSRYCQNQGFVLGNSLALQFHVEMQADMVRGWLDYYKDEIPAPAPGVQTSEEMLKNIDRRISALHVFADMIYGVWLKGFVHQSRSSGS